MHDTTGRRGHGPSVEVPFFLEAPQALRDQRLRDAESSHETINSLGLFPKLRRHKKPQKPKVVLPQHMNITIL